MSFVAIFIAILVAYLVLKLVSKMFWFVVKLSAATVIGFAVVSYHEPILAFAQGYLQ